jgi:hypothetical protein
MRNRLVGPLCRVIGPSMALPPLCFVFWATWGVTFIFRHSRTVKKSKRVENNGMVGRTQNSVNATFPTQFRLVNALGVRQSGDFEGLLCQRATTLFSIRSSFLTIRPQNHPLDLATCKPTC